MTVSEIATVLAWHDALNAQDVDTLVELSTGDVEIGDAHGAVQGHTALREWATSKGFLIEPGRMYVHDGVVVVEQHIGDAGSPRWAMSACAKSEQSGRRRSVSCTTKWPRCSVMTTWRRRWPPPN